MEPVVEGFPDPADRSRAIFERLRGDVALGAEEATEDDDVEAPDSPPMPVVPTSGNLTPSAAPADASSTAADQAPPKQWPEEFPRASEPEPAPGPAVSAEEFIVPRETSDPGSTAQGAEDEPHDIRPAAPPVVRTHGETITLPEVPPGELEIPEPPQQPMAPSSSAGSASTPTPTPPPSASAAPAPPPSPFARPLPRVMAVANQKGGVGKTTTAVNLGACLAELGYRVLVCDLDPQGNASTGLGLNPRNMQTSMYDVILNDVPLEDCVEPSSVRNLFVAPASLDLAGAEIELVPAFSRELRLKRAIEAAADDYDFVLIDCPPSLGLLTVNGLAAATEVVVPIQCEYYALEGLGQLLRNVALVQKNLNPKLEVSAIICVMYDARTKLSDQVVQEVRAHFGAKVCRNVVPRTVRLSEAPSFGQPIIAFDPTSRGAIAYRELAKEVSGGAPQRTR
jgi:chromosome partitioning protein